MKEIIYEFLDYIALEKKYSEHTEINYKIDLEKYASFLENNKKNYLKVKHQDISEYLISLKKSGFKSSSINRNLSALRSFYNYLERQKQIHTNPMTIIKSMKMEKRLPNYFKYDEFLAMLETLENSAPLAIRNVLILELLLATGIRVSELVNITLNAIVLKEHEIKVFGKGKKERIVFFGNKAEAALTNYLTNSRGVLLGNKNSDALLLNHLGNKLTDRGIRLIIANIIEKAAVTSKVSPHTFRHTFATMLLNEGCNIKSVQELLGHASLNTTGIYTHLTNEEIRRTYLKSHPRAKK